MNGRHALLIGILKQAGGKFVHASRLMQLMELDRNNLQCVINETKKVLKGEGSYLFISNEYARGYRLLDRRTNIGAQAAIRESLKSGRRGMGHFDSSSNYHGLIDPSQISDGKTAKLFAITQMYDHSTKLLEGVRSSIKLLQAADDEVANEIELVETEVTQHSRDFDPDNQTNGHNGHGG